MSAIRKRLKISFPEDSTTSEKAPPIHPITKALIQKSPRQTNCQPIARRIVSNTPTLPTCATITTSTPNPVDNQTSTQRVRRRSTKSTFAERTTPKNSKNNNYKIHHKCNDNNGNTPIVHKITNKGENMFNKDVDTTPIPATCKYENMVHSIPKDGEMTHFVEMKITRSILLWWKPVKSRFS